MFWLLESLTAILGDALSRLQFRMAKMICCTIAVGNLLVVAGVF